MARAKYWYEATAYSKDITGIPNQLLEPLMARDGIEAATLESSMTKERFSFLDV